MAKENKYTAQQVDIAKIAKALGHPARVAILEYLASLDHCYFGDIHDELPISKATVSQHLKELREANLIQGEIEPPKVRYCLNRENWKTAKKMFSNFFTEPICKDGRC